MLVMLQFAYKYKGSEWLYIASFCQKQNWQDISVVSSAISDRRLPNRESIFWDDTNECSSPSLPASTQAVRDDGH